jgi:hypothetical protein
VPVEYTGREWPCDMAVVRAAVRRALMHGPGYLGLSVSVASWETAKDQGARAATAYPMVAKGQDGPNWI